MVLVCGAFKVLEPAPEAFGGVTRVGIVVAYYKCLVVVHGVEGLLVRKLCGLAELYGVRGCRLAFDIAVETGHFIEVGAEDVACDYVGVFVAGCFIAYEYAVGHAYNLIEHERRVDCAAVGACRGVSQVILAWVSSTRLTVRSVTAAGPS